MKIRSSFVANSSSSSFIVMVNGATNNNNKVTFNPEDMVVNVDHSRLNLMNYMIVDNEFAIITKDNYNDYYDYLIEYYKPSNQPDESKVMEEAEDIVQYRADCGIINKKSQEEISNIAKNLANYHMKLYRIRNNVYNFNTNTAKKMISDAINNGTISYEYMYQLVKDYTDKITDCYRYIDDNELHDSFYNVIKNTIVCDEYFGDFRTYYQMVEDDPRICNIAEFAIYGSIDSICRPYIIAFKKLIQMAIIFHKNPNAVLVNLDVDDSWEDSKLHDALVDNTIAQNNDKVKVLWHERD